MNETVLVTGASGFVGSAVVRTLLEKGVHVRALVRESSPLDNLESLDVELINGDLRMRSTLERACAGCDGVFHVAADYRLWARAPQDIYANNLRGSRNVILAAKAAGVRRVVYTSSVATLGHNPDDTPANEDTPVSVTDMVGHYKHSKFLAEQKVRKLAAKENVDVVTVNPSTPVGPRDIKPTPTGRLILDAARGRMLAYVDTGLDIVHVDDVAQGHWAAYRHGTAGRRYVLGGDNMSLRDIIRGVVRVTGGCGPLLRVPHGVVLPAAHVSQWWARITRRTPSLTVTSARLARHKMYYSHARAARELNYQPRAAHYAFEDAVAWFKENDYC